MFEAKLLSILRNARGEYSERQIFQIWCSGVNSCSIAHILKRTNPAASKRTDASGSPLCLSNTHVHGPSAKREIDYPRCEIFKNRLKHHNQAQRTRESASISSAGFATSSVSLGVDSSKVASTGRSESLVLHSTPVICAQSTREPKVTDSRVNGEEEIMLISSSQNRMLRGMISKAKCSALPESEIHEKDV